MRFSIRLNNDLSIADAVELALVAEAAGFEQIWMSNDLFLRSAPVVLAAMAQATTRIGIGTGIMNPYTVHPAELAMVASTLQELSGGRFALGMAAGAGEFLEWVGLEQRRPARRMRETIVAVRALLAGDRPAEVVSGLQPRDDEFVWRENAFLRHVPEGPARQPVPIYLGASGPRMQELQGELADGGLSLLFPPERYRAVRERVAVGEQRRDGSLGPLDFAVCCWISVDEDPRLARLPLARKAAYYGPAMGNLLPHLGIEEGELDPIRVALERREGLDRAAELVDDRLLRVGVAGVPEQVIERLRPIVAAGADHLSFGPPLGPEPAAAVRLLGERVLPALA